MKNATAIPWEKIYQFTLNCGNKHQPKAFSIEVLNNLSDLCNFDGATIYYLDTNGKVYDQYSTDTDKYWNTLYLEYYSKFENGRYSLQRCPRENSSLPIINTRNWTQEPKNEFISNFIQPRNLRHTLGFVLYDINGVPKATFCLDKTIDTGFSNNEIAILTLAVPLINNLFKNLSFNQINRHNRKQNSWEVSSLTPRESEIASLLCQGFSPANISQLLHISQSTAYKHIANIHEKMKVSTRQELLVRLLN